MKYFHGTLFQLMRQLKELSERPGIYLEDLPFPLRDSFKQFMTGKAAQGGPGEPAFYYQRDVVDYFVSCMYRDGLPYELKLYDAEQGLQTDALVQERGGYATTEPDRLNPRKISLVLNHLKNNRVFFNLAAVALTVGINLGEFMNLLDTHDLEGKAVRGYTDFQGLMIIRLGYQFGIISRFVSEYEVRVDEVQARMTRRLDYPNEADYYEKRGRYEMARMIAEKLVNEGGIEFKEGKPYNWESEVIAVLKYIKPQA
jgi:hypothetical protein